MILRMTDEPATSIAIVRQLDAPPGVVWRAWTEPEVVALWWGSDHEGSVLSVALDVRPGGAFEISFRDSDGDEHTCFGSYTRVEVMTALEFTWSWRNEPNPPSRVRVGLAPWRGGTRMDFVHGELRGVSSHGYDEGWRRTFAKLDRALGSPLSS
jgi:uncharacterized protein YndB with AHSA1/START domain